MTAYEDYLLHDTPTYCMHVHILRKESIFFVTALLQIFLSYFRNTEDNSRKHTRFNNTIGPYLVIDGSHNM